MGAESFGVRAKGATAREAFAAAVEDAQWEHGHGGYSGTIAEKSKFKEFIVPEGVDPMQLAEDKFETDSQVDDKWGPAGCVKLAEGEYYFFGWASS